MASWDSQYEFAIELTEPVLNLALKTFLDVLVTQHQNTFAINFGAGGSLTATLTGMSISNLRTIAGGNGVECDFIVNFTTRLQLFGSTLSDTYILTISNVEITMPATPAGLPKGISLSITPNMPVPVLRRTSRVSSGLLAPALRFIFTIFPPVLTFGIWLAFRIIRKVDIPLWELVDVFSAFGIRYAQNCPVLVAQNAILPSSLIVASDFTLATPALGVQSGLKHFLPASTNAGVVLNDRLVEAAVQTAFAKGWAPSFFNIGGWKISINSLTIAFHQDTINASGSLRAKRGSCWCRVTAKISFSIDIKPKVEVTSSNSNLVYSYNANVNVHVSTSGMLLIMGIIMFTPLFLSAVIALSMLSNIILHQFLPYKTSWAPNGPSVTIQAAGSVTGFIPFSFDFPLQLSGQGSASLNRFQSFQLPGGSTLNVGFTNDSILIQEHELMAAVELT